MIVRRAIWYTRRSQILPPVSVWRKPRDDEHLNAISSPRTVCTPACGAWCAFSRGPRCCYITIDEQLQANKDCYFPMQAMLTRVCLFRLIFVSTRLPYRLHFNHTCAMNPTPSPFTTSYDILLLSTTIP